MALSAPRSAPLTRVIERPRPPMRPVRPVRWVMPPGATNESLAKGTLDASQFPWESVKGFRLAGVTSHHLKIPGGTYAGIFFLTMSPKTWKKLSAGQKAAVEKVSGEWGSRFISKKWDAAEQAGMEAARADGNTITVLSDAETAKLRKMVQPITDTWVARANKARAGRGGAAGQPPPGYRIGPLIGDYRGCDPPF